MIIPDRASFDYHIVNIRRNTNATVALGRRVSLSHIVQHGFSSDYVSRTCYRWSKSHGAVTLHPSQWLGGAYNNTPVALLFEHCDIVQAGSPVLYSLACAQGPPSYPYFGCERVCLKRRVMVTLYRYRHMRARCDGIRLSSEGRCYRTVLNVQSD